MKTVAIGALRVVMYLWGFLAMLFLIGWPFMLATTLDENFDKLSHQIIFGALYLLYLFPTILEGGNYGKGMAMVWEAIMLPLGDPAEIGIDRNR